MRFEISLRFCIFNRVCLIEMEEGKCALFGMVEEKEDVKQSLIKLCKRNHIETVNFVKISEEEFKKTISFNNGVIREGMTPFFKKQEKNERENAAAILLDTLIMQGCSRGATDIHLEGNNVRFRICGLLENVCLLEQERKEELIRRIKILCSMNVLESRKAQDGRFVFEKEGKRVFVRVSCVPSVEIKGSIKVGKNDETLVMRLLDPDRLPLKLEALGFSEKQCGVLRSFMGCKRGLVLVCGPTGSGKSTTAASMLMEISEGAGKKIICVENPPEYVLKNTTQMDVDEKKGFGFNQALRHVFRQDPDVIFIGEVRDEESAFCVIQAAVTGHLVLATIHASDLQEVFLRMKNLGVCESDLQSVLKGVVFQELRFENKRAFLVSRIKSFMKDAGAEDAAEGFV